MSYPGYSSIFSLFFLEIGEVGADALKDASKGNQELRLLMNKCHQWHRWCWMKSLDLAFINSELNIMAYLIGIY